MQERYLAKRWSLHWCFLYSHNSFEIFLIILFDARKINDILIAESI